MKHNLFFAGLGLASSCISVNALMPEDKILESSLAGSWYEADPAKLKKQILRWVESAALPEKLPVEKTIALISPHAGYAYSGPVAAYGLKALAGKEFDRIIILGPSHRVYMRNQICLPNASGLRTPLGVAETDREAVSKLARLDFVRLNDEIHYHEHSVQIQLPLLQSVLGSPFKVIPVITGQLDAEAARKTARALAPFLSPSTLVVISSDFTHYGRDFDYVPFRDNIAENLRKLDLGAFERIRTG
ncbi:MAG: AmmeMemoRadiSam system protein B, partial [Lentisphaeria bacterium]|nr:AmmeMemoRadiSam system protein B [Lentisphaeria bacterium]